MVVMEETERDNHRHKATEIVIGVQCLVNSYSYLKERQKRDFLFVGWLLNVPATG